MKRGCLLIGDEQNCNWHFPPLSSRRAGEPLAVGVDGAPDGALELGLGRPPYVDLEAAVPEPAA